MVMQELTLDPDAITAVMDPGVEYLRVLRDHGIGSPKALEFKAAHAEEAGFARRATGAERLVQYSEEILQGLGTEPVDDQF